MTGKRPWLLPGRRSWPARIRLNHTISALLGTAVAVEDDGLGLVFLDFGRDLAHNVVFPDSDTGETGSHSHAVNGARITPAPPWTPRSTHA